jgi:membrane-associated protease RseP (regulator of RpoE activity)
MPLFQSNPDARYLGSSYVFNDGRFDMKNAKFMLYFGVAFSLAFLALGCASAPPPAAPPAPVSAPAQSQAPKTDIWPKIYDDETYLTTFDSTWSEAEAVGVIKNIQNSIVEFKAGFPLSELDVDPYGMRARWTWVENGSFVKSAGFIIPFDQITSLLLEYYPALTVNYKWGLLVYIAGGTTVSVRNPTRDAAERLGKAIIALAKARGAALHLPDIHFGATLGQLTDAQAQAAGILQSSGVIVMWVFKDSPAERAAFSPQDIITSVNGTAVHKPEEVSATIDAAFKSGVKDVKISGIRRSYRVENGKYIEQFVPLSYTLAFDNAGGVK